MLDKAFAEQFAKNWIEVWNSHDLDRILALYTDDFEFTSPKIPQIAGEPSGYLKGKSAVGAYWTKGLALLPNLKFDLITTFAGINSIVLHYRNERGLICAETFEFDANGLIYRSGANHAIQE